MRGVPAEQQAANSSAAASPPAVLFIWTAPLQGSEKSSVARAEIKQVRESSSKSPLALQANPNLRHHSASQNSPNVPLWLPRWSRASLGQGCYTQLRFSAPGGRDVLLHVGFCSSPSHCSCAGNAKSIPWPQGQKRGGFLPPWCLIWDADWFDNVLTASGCCVSPTCYSLGFLQNSQKMGCATPGLTLLESLNESDCDVVSFWSSDLQF